MPENSKPNLLCSENLKALRLFNGYGFTDADSRSDLPVGNVCDTIEMLIDAYENPIHILVPPDEDRALNLRIAATLERLEKRLNARAATPLEEKDIEIVDRPEYLPKERLASIEELVTASGLVLYPDTLVPLLAAARDLNEICGTVMKPGHICATSHEDDEPLLYTWEHGHIHMIEALERVQAYQRETLDYDEDKLATAVAVTHCHARWELKEPGDDGMLWLVQRQGPFAGSRKMTLVAITGAA